MWHRHTYIYNISIWLFLIIYLVLDGKRGVSSGDTRVDSRRLGIVAGVWSVDSLLSIISLKKRCKLSSSCKNNTICKRSSEWLAWRWCSGKPFPILQSKCAEWISLEKICSPFSAIFVCFLGECLSKGCRSPWRRPFPRPPRRWSYPRRCPESESQ